MGVNYRLLRRLGHFADDLRAIYPESGLDMETLPRKELYESLAKNLILPLSLLVLAGCGLSINHPASFDPSLGTTAAVNSAVPIEGHVWRE